MAATASGFAELLEPKLSNIWHDAFSAQESLYSRAFNIRDMSKNKITDALMAGFGPLQTQADGDDVTFDDPLGIDEKEYTYVVKGLAYRVHERLWRNDLYGEVERYERDLMDSATDDTEQTAWNIFINGFGTTNVGFDGLALYSTAHTRKDGGSNQKNNPSTDEALSVTGLQNAVIEMKKWKNHRGRPRQHTARRLIVPPDLMMTAYEILDSALIPYKGDNTKNVIASRFGIEDPLIVPYLTSATAWHVQADQHDLNLFWRFRPESGMRTNWDTDSVERKVRQGLVAGFGMWEGNYGTDGVA